MTSELPRALMIYEKVLGNVKHFTHAAKSFVIVSRPQPVWCPAGTIANNTTIAAFKNRGRGEAVLEIGTP
jgi:hypothetical protein